jgi:hypothetical protein
LYVLIKTVSFLSSKGGAGAAAAASKVFPEPKTDAHKNDAAIGNTG